MQEGFERVWSGEEDPWRGGTDGCRPLEESAVAEAGETPTSHLRHACEVRCAVLVLAGRVSGPDEVPWKPRTGTVVQMACNKDAVS